MRRNAGTIRTLFDEPALGAGIVELREDLDAGVAAGSLPPHDTGLMAAAMVGAASRSAWRWSRASRSTPTASAAFVTSIFVGAFLHMR